MNKYQEPIIALIIVLLLGIAAFAGANFADETINSRNINFDNHRDKSYEHYCDSIWINNPDYYKDVLEETDEYQNYINEHGEWRNY